MASQLLYMQVKQRLMAAIRNLKAGDHIPSRNSLMKEFKVTRVTVDRAVSELIGEGLLYAVDGSGTYVAERKEKRPDTQQNAVPIWSLIIPDILQDIYPDLVRGVEDTAHENHINVIICNTDNRTEKQSGYVLKHIESRTDGVILIPALIGQEDLSPIHRLSDLGIPLVFCNRGIAGIGAPRVISNNSYGSYVATTHLLEMGYRRCAFISTPVYSTSLERYQGYCAALSEEKLEVMQNLVVFEKSYEIERPGYESARALLALEERPDAFVCLNDRIAQGAYSAIVDAGLAPGEDIGLVGYGNTSICESLPVKLTSVKFRSYEIGKRAAEFLLDMMKGTRMDDTTIAVLQPELVVRESSGSRRAQNGAPARQSAERKENHIHRQAQGIERVLLDMKATNNQGGAQGPSVGGVVVPLVTPVTRDGGIDFAMLESLATWHAQSGVRGLFVAGSTGRFSHFSPAQNAEICRAVSRVVGGRLTVFGGCCDSGVNRMLANADLMRAAGADVVVATPPYYLTYLAAEAERLLEEMADKSPLPVVFYNIPELVGYGVRPEWVADIASHPNVVGYKDSSNRLDDLLKILSLTKNKSFAVLVGKELILEPALRAGAAGIVVSFANVFPEVFVRMLACRDAADWDGVADCQRTVGKIVADFGTRRKNTVFSSLMFYLEEELDKKGFPAKLL